jgi:MFS superfamily sulfate permease-like transporter
MIEYIYSFVAALAVGVIVALTGYFLNLSAMRKERKDRASEQLRSAIRSILVELKENSELAKKPMHTNIMESFTAGVWDYHKGEIRELPQNVQTAIHEAYISIREANALVENNLRLPYGGGTLNDRYKEKKNEVTEKTAKAIELCKDWFKQQ